MSREIGDDFKEFKEFIDKYSLKHLLQEPNFNSYISQQHKKLFAFLTFIAELDFQKNDPNKNLKLTQDQISYLTESCSDVGNSIFLNIHGAYKASRLMMRSSIETFIKGFCLDSIPQITTIKSTYEMFDQAKVLAVFANDPLTNVYSSIHSIYADLCRDTHTANLSNMQHTIGFNYYPEYLEEETKKTSALLINLTTYYLTCLAVKYKEYLLSMHHRNRENIVENLPAEIRSFVFGG